MLLLPPRRQHAQSDQAIALKGLLKHRAVARLKNMQRLHDVGKHHKVWQWKNARLAGKLIGREREGFVGHQGSAGGGGV